LGVTRDISERKRAEQELRCKEEQLQEALEKERTLRQELETEMEKRAEFTRALVH
jgi:PAS domain-containing protein